MKSDRAYLQHILDMINRVESATDVGKDVFFPSMQFDVAMKDGKLKRFTE